MIQLGMCDGSLPSVTHPTDRGGAHASDQRCGRACSPAAGRNSPPSCCASAGRLDRFDLPDAGQAPQADADYYDQVLPGQLSHPLLHHRPCCVVVSGKDTYQQPSVLKRKVDLYESLWLLPALALALSPFCSGRAARTAARPPPKEPPYAL